MILDDSMSYLSINKFGSVSSINKLRAGPFTLLVDRELNTVFSNSLAQYVILIGSGFQLPELVLSDQLDIF